MSHHCHDPKYLRDRAEELRALAEDLHPGPRESLLRCADDYEKLAKRAEEREPGGQS